MSIDMSKYGDLAETGFGGKKAIDPKDEFFHSLYICQNTRTNEASIVEQPNKLQARGMAYNLDEIHGIILHVKPIHVFENNNKVQCFSWRLGPPAEWKGTDGHSCGSNSAERAADPHCSGCRAQIIVSFLYTDASGNPILNDGAPSYFFIRAKGYKYSAVADYLSDLSQREDLDALVDISTPEGLNFEQTVVRNKRFVTKLKRDIIAGTQYGDQNVFKLEAVTTLTKEDAEKMLEVASKTVEKFNEKMDWSKNKTNNQAQQATANNPSVTLDAIPEVTPQESTPQTTEKSTETKVAPKIDFDKIAF